MKRNCFAVLFLLVAVLSSVPLSAQQLRPSSQVEFGLGAKELALDSEGPTSAVLFVETISEGVFVSVSQDGSLTWSPPLRLDTAAAGITRVLTERAVQVRQGEVFVAWIEQDLSGPDTVHVRRSADGGFIFQVAAILPDVSTATDEIPSAVLEVQNDDPNDDVHVLYRLDDGGGIPELYLASSDPNAVDTFLPPVLVRSSFAASVEQMDFDVTNDLIHVVWVEDRTLSGDVGLWYRRSDDRGVSWLDPEVRLDSGGAPGAVVLPDLRVHANPPGFGFGGLGGNVDSITAGLANTSAGLVWVVWREDASLGNGIPELRSTVSDDVGETFDPPQTIGGYTPGVDSVQAFACELDLSQGLLVAWEDVRFGYSNVFAARSDDGVLFSADSNPPDMNITATGPRVTLDADGTAGVAWIEPGANALVGGAFSLDAGETWSLPIGVSDPTGNAASAEVVYNPSCENMIHAWLDDAGTNTNVFAGGYFIDDCTCFFADDGGGGGCNERVYTPDVVTAGHVRQRLTVFYPDTNVHTKPTAGWPVILYSPAGAFAEAAPLGTAASALPAICGEPPTSSSSSNGIGLKFLNDALQSGYAVITVGTIGWNSSQVGDYNPNLFFDPTSVEWNRGDVFWGEQEFTWARQYIAAYADQPDPMTCPPLEIDNDRVVVCGTSTGAIYSAFVALGPDRKDSGTDPLLSQSTRCAGAILLESPSWFSAYKSSLPGFHWPSSSDKFTRAASLSSANLADLEASSISTHLRDPNSMAVDTPVFIAFDEPLQSLDFSRDGSCSVDPALNDPSLLSTLDEYVHDAWFSLILAEDLACIAPTFHSKNSRLWIADSVDLDSLPDVQDMLYTGRFPGTVQGDTLQNKALQWLLLPRACTNLLNDVDLGCNSVANPECFATISEPVVCGIWRSSVDTSSHPGATGTTVLTYSDVFPSSFCHKGYNIFPNIGSVQLGLTFASPDADIALHQNTIPSDVTLFGESFYTQAAISGNNMLTICNALELVLGS